jgi:hypothetical protein
MFLLCVFFGGIAYLVTGNVAWAVVIGAGWWIIAGGILLVIAAIGNWCDTRRNRRRAARRQAGRTINP